MSQYYGQGGQPAPQAQPAWRPDFDRAFRSFATGDFESAVDICRQIEWTHDTNPAVLHLLGSSLSALGEYGEARTAFDRSLAINPRNPQLLCDIAYTHRMERAFDRSHAFVDQALAMMPTYHAALRAKAELLVLDREPTNAHALLQPIVMAGPDKGGDHPNVVLAFGEVCIELDRSDDAVALLETLVADESRPPQYRASASIMLGKIHEKAGDYESAWPAYAHGNMLTPVPGDPVEMEAWVDRQISEFSQQSIAGLPRASNTTDLPVFIVGFPRSGTSLVEQILACHPDLFGAGERSLIPLMSRSNPVDGWTQASIDAAAQEYIDAITPFVPSGTARITDKNPGSYMHLGFINAILPGARIIRCVRDPIDTCLSCFTQDFSYRHPYSLDLGWCGRAYKAYDRMMSHFENVIDLPVHTVRYEDLVNDQERITRELLDFVGLPWNEACLSPHKSERATITASGSQVREPMYTSSVGRAERFADHLGPLKAALGVG
jgi:Sulfotransferase family/Tetratricopeptide repeat